MKRSRFQFGTLYTEARKIGVDVWGYRWRDTNLDGRRQYRKQILGTVQEIPTQAEVPKAARPIASALTETRASMQAPPNPSESHRAQQAQGNADEQSRRQKKAHEDGRHQQSG